jgi:hypothetical protein
MATHRLNVFIKIDLNSAFRFDHNQQVGPSLSMTTYNSLAEFLANGVETGKPDQTDEICPICRFEADDDQSEKCPSNGPMIKPRSCGHHFHQLCLMTWLTDDGLDARSGCPTCRHELYVGGFRGRGNVLQAQVESVLIKLSTELHRWVEAWPQILKGYDSTQGLWRVVLRYQMGLDRDYTTVVADLIAVNREDQSWSQAIETASCHLVPERIPNGTERVTQELEKTATEQ